MKLQEDNLMILSVNVENTMKSNNKKKMYRRIKIIQMSTRTTSKKRLKQLKLPRVREENIGKKVKLKARNLKSYDLKREYVN